MSKQKILIVTPLYPPDMRGPATYTKLVEDELKARNYEVSVISFGDVKHLPKGISHLTLFFKVWYRAYAFDVIYAQDTVSVGLPSLLAAKITGRKFMVRVPGDHAWEQAYNRFGVTDLIDEFQKKRYGFRTEFLRFIQGLVVRYADRVVTPSLYFKKLVSGWVGDSSHIHAIYNGVKQVNFQKTKNELRKEFGFSGVILFSAGSLEPWKGFETLIEVTRELSKTVPNISLYIAGDGDMRGKLEKLKEEVPSVHLLGKIPRDKVIEYLLACDIFVLNSGFESFAFQVVEAQMCGTAIAVSNIGSLPELITDGQDGLVFEYNNKEEMKEKIELLIKDPSLREKLGKVAKKKSKQFSIERTVNELIKVIESL